MCPLSSGQVSFAYFAAVEAYDAQKEPSSVWRMAFEAAREPHTHVLQNLFLGVNAHINYDLVLTLVDLLQDGWADMSAEQRRQRYEDYCTVNDIIAATINSVQDRVIERYDPGLDVLDKLMGPLDEWLIARLITGWREEVWQHAGELLKPVNKTLSLLAAVSRLAMTTIHGLNLLNYYFVLQLVDGGNLATAFAPEQVQALVTMFLDAHSTGFSIGVAFLVIHVFTLGYLIVKSGYFPKVLGYLFIAAGVGYLVDTAGLLLVPGYTTTPAVIAMVIAAAEIAFPIWLLVKGVNMERWQSHTLALETA